MINDYEIIEKLSRKVCELHSGNQRLRARVELLEDALREIADHHPESKMTRALVRFVGLEAKP